MPIKHIVLAFLLVSATFAGIRPPGKYEGVVIFDRWDECHLYSGVSIMEISEKVKETLRPFNGKALAINAQEVWQPVNPGDGLITKLEVLGPADEPLAAPFGRPPVIEGLSLRVVPSFPAHGPDELVIELRNEGKSVRQVNTNDLAPTLFSKMQGLECWPPVDGPSYSAVTRMSVAFLGQNGMGGSCLVNGRGRTTRLMVAPGFSVSEQLNLNPGQSIEVPLRFELSAGEYEFLAGYGGGVHEARSLASNRLSFDVDSAGKGHLVGEALALNQVRPERRLGPVCGRVVTADGKPAIEARVFLWPWPISTDEPKAAKTALSDQDGSFRIDSVAEGKYALTASGDRANGVSYGVIGGTGMSDAIALSLPDSAGNCSLYLTLHQQSGYVIRGQTQPAAASSPGRSAHLKMTRGDAYPFESTVAIQPDGRYEFRNVPAGRYGFGAGWTGSGFEVKGDIDNLRIDIKWPNQEERDTIGHPAGADVDEAVAIMVLRSLISELRAYAGIYKTGFAGSLSALGRAPASSPASAEHAGLMDVPSTLPGYTLTYVPGKANENGMITAYSVSARPTAFGKTGTHSFVLDESGVIHATDADRPATKSDPVWKD